MSNKYKQNGDVIDVVAGGTIASGSVQVVSKMIGIALKGAVSGETYPLAVKGVYAMLAKVSQAFAIGDNAYWNTTLNRVVQTPEAGNDFLIGQIVEAKTTGAGGAETINVRLSGQAPATAAE